MIKLTSQIRARLCLTLLLPLALAGCGFERVGRKAFEPQPIIPPVLPVMPAANPNPDFSPRADGSLWTPGLSGNPFSDDKAFRRGDIVLVRVVQKSSGTKKANLDTKRNSSISANIKYLLGMEKGINSVTGYAGAAAAATAAASNDLINAQSARQYSGQGSTERTDDLTATVSAIVTDVMSNGNLMIYGHQTVMLDNESSVLTVQGIIRPSDIDAQNSIDSTRLANANIRFTGSGVLSDGQHPGWGTRIFDWVWPF